MSSRLQNSPTLREDVEKEVKTVPNQNEFKSSRLETEVSHEPQLNKESLSEQEKGPLLGIEEFRGESSVCTETKEEQMTESMNDDAEEQTINYIDISHSRRNAVPGDEHDPATVPSGEESQTDPTTENEPGGAPIKVRLQEGTEFAATDILEECCKGQNSTSQQGSFQQREVRDETESIILSDMKDENGHILKSSDKEAQGISEAKDDISIMSLLCSCGNFRPRPCAYIIYMLHVQRIQSQHPRAIGDVPWEWLSDEKWRLYTYAKYPHKTAKAAILLAALGFAYCGSGTGSDDSVICIFCCIIKRGWRPSDDISDVHRKLSPGCPMVTGVNCNNKPMIVPQDGAILFDRLHQQYRESSSNNITTQTPDMLALGMEGSQQTSSSQVSTSQRHRQSSGLPSYDETDSLSPVAAKPVRNRSGYDDNSLPGRGQESVANMFTDPDMNTGAMAAASISNSEGNNSILPTLERSPGLSPEALLEPTGPGKRPSDLAPKYPDFADQAVRVASFRNASFLASALREGSVNTFTLAASGFFYDDAKGISIFQCFHCGFSRFHLDDSLLEEHRDCSTGCLLVAADQNEYVDII